MPEAPSIAADTNVLLDYAKEDETVLDCFSTLRRRLPGSADEGENEEIRQTARKALHSIFQPWDFQPVNCVPVGHGIVEQIARSIRQRGLIPDSEINDSYVVTEAALIGISILLSADAHLKDIPYEALKLVLDAADVPAPLIASPWKIVHQFFR
jgi:hypothetical protein